MAVQTVIKMRRSTAAQWTSANPILAAGESGLETDTKKVKIGDGTTAWASLGYQPNLDTNIFTGLQIFGTSGTYISSGTGRAWFQSSNTTAAPIVAKGAASQTANLQEWQNSAGTVLAKVNQSGLLTAQGITGTYYYGYNNNAVIHPSISSTLPLVAVSTAATSVAFGVRGATSQTANLQEWQNSTGTVLASVNPSGQFIGDGSQLTGIVGESFSPFMLMGA